MILRSFRFFASISTVPLVWRVEWGEQRVASSRASQLAGKALDYLIGANGSLQGDEVRVTETPFGAPPAMRGVSIAYCNLRREEGEPPAYGPYLEHDDIFREYGEGRPDPSGEGFRSNLIEQLDHCKRLGHTLVEQDNPELVSALRGTARHQPGAGARTRGRRQESQADRTRRGRIRPASERIRDHRGKRRR